MVQIDQNKLQAAIDAYKKYFPTKIGDEIYKWKAVKCFQDNWDIDAEDFAEMFWAATGKTENLITSINRFPRKMLYEFAKLEQECVRNMFKGLFDERLELEQRISEFIKGAEALCVKHFPGKMHYQDLNSISTYLWMRYPDKYFIFKYSEVKRAINVLGANFEVKKGASISKVSSAFEMFEIMAEALNHDANARPMLNAVLTNDCYKDEYLHTMTVDLTFFISRYYNEAQASSAEAVKQRTWMFSPGEQACTWDECLANGEMYLGWDEIGDLTQYETREQMTAKMKEVYDADKTYVNSSLATWEFANEISVGDIIYARKGRYCIIGRGVVTGDYHYEPSREHYQHVKSVKWEIVGEWPTEYPHALKTLTEITQYHTYIGKLEATLKGDVVPEDDCHYWWLCANPKVWSIAEWPLGDEQEYTLLNENGHKRRIYQNFLDAKAGDKVICYETTPTKQIIGLAIVSHEQDGIVITFEKQETLTSPIDFVQFRDMPELKDMEFLQNPNGSFFRLTKDEYDFIMDLIRESNSLAGVKDEYEKYTREDFLKEVFMTEENLDALEQLVKTKKNVILQGAPGVGKTFSAKRLAYMMMGCKDDSRIGLVQFHQNYSYEDFIMGYKPSGDTFELQRGQFYKFCINAANNPDKDYFFIIDEINRGNLSKIFGELLMLIEKDYRGERLTLAYKDEKFFVPKNIFIIGMMNTADRSLAMIDYALRRRFSFFDMKPGFNSTGFQEYMHKFNNPHFEALVNAIVELNKKITDDDSLGEGFKIGHSYFCGQTSVTDAWLKSVVKYDIIPMLQEYWFDNKSEVKISGDRLLAVLND